MQNKPFIGVVLGGDMNSYAVARAFYEAYGIRTVVLGLYPIHPTKDSKLIEGYYYSDLFEDAGLIHAVTELQEKYPDKKKIMFGATDQYVKHIINNREAIREVSDTYIIPMTSADLYDRLYEKKSFYQLCEQYGLRYPKSMIFNIADGDENMELPFEYPVFFKPSISAEYAEYEFEGKQKGYKVENAEEFRRIVNIVRSSGFPGDFIVQEYIEGKDDSMFVYTLYVNSEHKAEAITGGRILMEDRTPELIGNYNAISNARDVELSMKLKEFVEGIGFTGICHFDIQYVEDWDEYVVFEINIRQGRSNMYTLASGVNLAQYVVEDYIYHDHKDDFYIADKEFTVSAVSEKRLKKALAGTSAEQYISSNFYRFQLAPYDKGLKRSLRQEKADRLIMEEYFKHAK